MKTAGVALLVGACAVSQASIPAFAGDLLGLYVGGAFGQGKTTFEQLPDGTPLGFDEQHLGWNLALGLRPISPIGAEFQYIDFGHPRANLGFATADAHVNGVALFAVGYLPLPVPLLDIYGKLGFARLKTTVNAEPQLFLGLACSSAHPIFSACGFSQDKSDTRFAWGIGAQVKLPVTPIRVRAEYERFDSSNGDPSMLSIGVTWNF
jgi:opacity protein-like surface antigen